MKNCLNGEVHNFSMIDKVKGNVTILCSKCGTILTKEIPLIEIDKKA